MGFVIGYSGSLYYLKDRHMFQYISDNMQQLQDLKAAESQLKTNSKHVQTVQLEHFCY